MRASVLILAAVVATAACRDNPGFMLSGGSRSDSGETGAAETEAASEGSETGDAVCAPVPDRMVGDACQQQPLPATPPDLANTDLFSSDECGVGRQIYVKRTANLLHECSDAACSDCPMQNTVGIGKASIYSKYDDLLPQEDGCARLWHLGGNISGTGDDCSSTAYAVFDTDADARLRFAVAYGTANPFMGLEGFVFGVTPSSPAPCTDALFQKDCGDKPAATFNLDFNFEGCQIPDVYFDTDWSGIVARGTRYKLEVLASAVCVGDDPLITWFLYRE